MNKKVLIISTSLRAKSNSQRMAEEFAKGVKDSGNSVEIISLADKTINFCKGCMACHKLKKCVINDDAILIADKMKISDVVVFATPIYYYEMSGLMKTLLDRMNPLYGSDYKFTEVYFLSCAADDNKNTNQRAENGLQGWIECFERASLKGSIFAGGVNDCGEIENHIALQQAYETGKAI